MTCAKPRTPGTRLFRVSCYALASVQADSSSYKDLLIIINVVRKGRIKQSTNNLRQTPLISTDRGFMMMPLPQSLLSVAYWAQPPPWRESHRVFSRLRDLLFLKRLQKRFQYELRASRIESTSLSLRTRRPSRKCHQTHVKIAIWLRSEQETIIGKRPWSLDLMVWKMKSS